MGTRFLDSRFILPTSNICERLFSKVGNALNDRQVAIAPVNLESRVFLNVNRDLWSAEEFDEL